MSYIFHNSSCSVIPLYTTCWFARNNTQVFHCPNGCANNACLVPPPEPCTPGDFSCHTIAVEGEINFTTLPISWSKTDETERLFFNTSQEMTVLFDTFVVRQLNLTYFGAKPATYTGSEFYPSNHLVLSIGNPSSPELFARSFANVEDWFDASGNPIAQAHNIKVTWDSSPENQVAVFIDGVLKGVSREAFAVAGLQPVSQLENLEESTFTIFDTITSPPTGLESLDNYWQNPFFDIDTGDPTVIKHDGTYYLYGDSYSDWRASGENMPKKLSVWVSTDLVNWEKSTESIMDSSTYYGVNQYIGGVVEYNGKFYLFYSGEVPSDLSQPAKGRDCGRAGFTRRNALAVSDSLFGPFTTVAAPLTPDLAKDIYCEVEAQAFVDDSKVYLYVAEVKDSSPEPGAQLINIITGFKFESLSPTGASLNPKRVVLLEPAQSWEKFFPATCPWCGIVEGADVIKVGGVYFLVYSGNHARRSSYALGYATSSSPLGPFGKASENPFIKPDFEKGVFGPGNGSFVKSLNDEETLYFYHAKLYSDEGWLRILNFDKLEFDTANRRIITSAPTRTPQKILSR